MTEPRFVSVAVDAPGVGGGRLFTYRVPPRLADIRLGEAVIVEYGRRRAVGLLIDETAAPEMEAKPLLARVRSDGPLLDDLLRRLARHVAEHYLAPPGLVVRAMLPPGSLERIELFVTALDAPEGVDGSPGDALVGLLERVGEAGSAGLPTARLEGPTGRVTLSRQLRQLEAEGRVLLEWRLLPAEVRPRTERWARLSEAGRAVAASLGGGERTPGAPLGPRQRALLSDPQARADDGEPAARLAERHGASAVSGLARRGLLVLDTRTRARLPLAGRAEPARGTRPPGASLDAAQQAASAVIGAAVRARQPAAFLLEGDTASGKSAVYSTLIAAALETGRGALVLVPEIALTTPLIDRLRHDLGIEVAMLHSAMSEGERSDEWGRIRRGEMRVVVGTRVAVLSPPRPLGVVVVDEEHDAAYKSDRTPRYQARDLAVELGRLADAPVVLGSATPDVVTVGLANQGTIQHLRLHGRRSGARASVEVVDMRDELAAGNRGLLSAALAAALEGLDRSLGDRAILLINRRGSASIVLCRDCGYVQACPECLRPLVFHASVVALRCHHCGASAPVARRCPACESVRIRYLGGGTEKVESELRLRFPGFRVARLDRDVVERRGEAARVVDAFTEGALDVLVGTSLVAKGLDIPEVTLVGVVSADIALNLPDERAAERTWQLLTQAVGRAGRGSRPGRAIIQTYQPVHPAIRAVAEDDPGTFLAAELEQRRRFRSPPFGRLIKLTAALPDRDTAIATARGFAEELRARSAQESAAVEVLGPVPAYIARRGGRWRFHLVLRGSDPAALLGGDPGPPWSVDVDPESLL